MSTILALSCGCGAVADNGSLTGYKHLSIGFKDPADLRGIGQSHHIGCLDFYCAALFSAEILSHTSWSIFSHAHPLCCRPGIQLLPRQQKAGAPPQGFSRAVPLPGTGIHFPPDICRRLGIKPLRAPPSTFRQRTRFP